MSSALTWIAIPAYLAALMFGLGLGLVDVGTLTYVLILTVAVVVLAVRAANDSDRSWLPGIIFAGFVAKLVGSALRFYILVNAYDRVGDALGYYHRGKDLAPVFRTFRWPEVTYGSSGTVFVSKVTGLLFTPYTPSELGGFFLFGTIAFVGQVLFYLAYRRVMPQASHRLYALAIFFLPSLVFWPSSIGKESLLIFFLGGTAWGTAHLLGRYRIRWVGLVGLMLLLVAAVRPHMAALYGGALAIAVLVGRSPGVTAAATRRLILMGAASIGVVLLVTFASQSLDVDLSGSDLDPFLAELQRNTQQGGSAVEGRAVRSLQDIPPAILRTLYRPLFNEVNNIQTGIAAVEGTLLLVVSIVRVPTMLRDIRRWRRYPYMLFAVVVVIGFVVGFSAVFNLGILTRQRTQALPLLLVLLIGLRKAEAPADRQFEMRHDDRTLVSS